MVNVYADSTAPTVDNTGWTADENPALTPQVPRLIVSIPQGSKRCSDWLYHPRALDGSALPRALGMNGFTAVAFSFEAPFLNIVKWASGAIPEHPWTTVVSGQGNFATSTGEEQWVQLDANGYPTSMTLGNGFTGSQQCNAFQLGIFENWNNGFAPNQTDYYPPGSYTVIYGGTGTLKIYEGGTTTTITASGQTFNVSGTSSGISVKLTATSAAPGNLTNLQIVRTSELTSYQAGAIFRPEWLAMMAGIKRFRTMQWQRGDNLYQSFALLKTPKSGDTSAIMVGSYSGATGLLFSAPPASGATSATLQGNWTGSTGSYLTQFSNGDQRTVTLTNGQTSANWSSGGGGLSSAASAVATPLVVFTAAPGSGAKTGTLVNPWWRSSGSYPLTFSDGSEQAATFTAGSTTVNWSTGVGAGLTADAVAGFAWPNGNIAYNTVLSSGATISATYTRGSSHITFSALGAGGADVLGYALCPGDGTWANRAQVSFVSYACGNGVPYEVCIAAANALGADPHFSLRVDVDNNHVAQFCALCLSTLNVPRRFHPEYINEGWNSSYIQTAIVAMYGAAQFGQASGVGTNGYPNSTIGDNWMGFRCAGIADACASACGAQFERCAPGISSQTGFAARFDTVMQTPLWGTDTPQNHPVKQVFVAPYFGSFVGEADMLQIMSVADPLSELFALCYSNVGTVSNGSKVYSIGSTGWCGAARSNVLSVLAKFTGTSGYKTKVNGASYIPQLSCYEWGPNWYSSDTQNGQAAVTGFGALITSMQRDARIATVIKTELEWWAANVGAGIENVVNVFCNVSPVSGFGDFGILESPLQTISPLSSAPAKFQGVQNYISAG